MVLCIISARAVGRPAVQRGAEGAGQRDQISACSPFSPSKRLA